jgi:predicted molibdopterin-dependent oxidoreductase YjgC
MRTNGATQPGAWDDGLRRVADALKRLKDAKALDRAGVILSSHMTNENLFAAKRFFAALGVRNVVFQRPKSGDSDQLLIQPDKSPNAKGAQALGLAEGADALLDRAAKKQISLLWVFAQDLAEVFGESRMAQAAQSVELLVFQGSNAHRTAALAHVVLPSAVYAEQDGTFTNFQGRVQRIRAALTPWGESKPDYQILSELAGLLGLGLACVDPQALFADLAKGEKPFHGLSYQSLGDQGALLKDGVR